jgi:membrane protein DedA with SNARE-associated domain
MDIESWLLPATAPFAVWVEAHARWAGPLVFLICLGESLVVVSALVPATIMLLAIGGVAATGLLDLPTLCAWGVAGSGLGFWVSYEMGRRWSAQILAWRWLAKRPELIARGHRFFARWGVGAVFVSRFVGPGRVVVPLLAGALGEKPRGFHLGNWLSAILWTPMLLAPTTAATWVSAQIESLPPSMRAPTVIALIAIAVIVWRAWRERVTEKR